MSTWAITVVGFVVVITALVVLELLGRSTRSRIPALGEWLGYLMRARAGRALILLGWLWLGWHYFARLTQTARRQLLNSGPPGTPQGWAVPPALRGTEPSQPVWSGLPGTQPTVDYR